MRSPADRLAGRRAAEWVLRAGAMALLGWCLWAATLGARASAASGSPDSGAAARAALRATLDTARVAPQLAGWTRRADLPALHLELAHVPDARARDWLRALHHAGSSVTWSGEIPALAIAAEPIADPRGGVLVRVAAPDGAVVTIADAGGMLDSLAAGAGGGAVMVPNVAGALGARAGRVHASIAPAGARTLRPVVVLGQAGWEAKFIAAALEEQGWRVVTRMPVAPGLATTSPLPPFDTARVSAVVALDSSAARDAGAIVRFVRAGGGVVLGAGAARHPAFAPLVAGRAGATLITATSPAAALAPVTRQTLAIAPIIALHPDAIPLERRDGHVVLAARRVDAGRVIQLGYDESWRWRMAGGEEAPDAHRRWWGGLVGAAAYAPAAYPPAVDPSPPHAPAADAAAPRVALVAALGAPSPAPHDAASRMPFDPSRSLSVYLAVALLLLLEWGSRRLRGAK